ncbi:MAG: ATP-grasp domain-containing protein [Gammaproteobacteria bacterium]|jgi:D-alanine-D-alanine ligase
MKKLRILVLVHEDLVPPDTLEGYSDKEIVEWKTEYDVISTLRDMGHEVIPMGVYDDLGKIRRAIRDHKPHIAFNLLEEFHGNSLYDYHIASYMELMRLPYTGCNPRGLMLAHDKALSKKLLTFHRINTPRFISFPLGRKVRVPKHVHYPLIVKSLVEEGSYGLSQASVVYTEEKLLERVHYLQDKLETPVIAEEFIDGREMYISIIGNQRLQVLPVLELMFGDLPEDTHRIATSRIKWDWDYQDEHKIKVELADLPEQFAARLATLGKRIYKILGVSGYVRIDLRVTEEEKVYVLEANANPDIGYGEELSLAGEAAGMSYEQLLQKIINLGLGYRSDMVRI